METNNIRLREPEGAPSAKRKSRWMLWLVVLAGTALAAIALVSPFGLFRWTRGGIRLRGAPGPSTIKPRPVPLTEAEKGLTGTWSWSTGRAGSSLVLAPDGTFKVSRGACLGSSEAQGTWNLEDKRLLLRCQSSYSRDHGEGGAPYWEADARTDQYWVVPWGQRVFLVEPSDMDEFVEDVNTNCERGQGGRARYSREGRGAPPVTGQPDLPAPWKERLLPGEIRGKVIEVVETGKFRVNIGSRDGVKDGMLLFVGGGTKAYPVNLRVISTLDSESTLEIKSNDQKLEVKVGSAVSSHAYDFDAEGNMVDR